ncbi:MULTISPECIES: winged helix-turn-helix transcriptional regulator [unclassified Streptomyces]|uniref:winged helix-turn-helix transcriptional regulator n=1 Tax=unclassified Streptomyces TaxID=2593676 RepID=UPI003868061A
MAAPPVTARAEALFTIATLRRLERDGLVTRTVRNTKPPRVDYALTARGLSLLGIVQSLARWAEDNSGGILDSRTTFDAEQA